MRQADGGGGHVPPDVVGRKEVRGPPPTEEGRVPVALGREEGDPAPRLDPPCGSRDAALEALGLGGPEAPGQGMAGDEGLPRVVALEGAAELDEQGHGCPGDEGDEEEAAHRQLVWYVVTVTPETAPADPFVQAALAGLAPGSVETAVDPRDEMLGHLAATLDGDRDRARFHYFRSGRSIARSLSSVLRWRFGESLGRLDAALDFASGYGRVSRFLAGAIPPGRLWVSDVYAEGVAFQRDRFGVHGFASTLVPEELSAPCSFDAILVTSLFTHLAADRFERWLARLFALLRPGGVLCFSTHAPELRPQGASMPDSGILFVELSESGSLPTADYGSSWVSKDFVRGAVQRAAGERTVSLHRFPRGLCNFQDLYVAAADEEVELAALPFRGEPELMVERCRLQGGVLSLVGWAGDRGGPVREVVVEVDGSRLGSAAIHGPRPDVVALFGSWIGTPGWSCRVELAPGTSPSRALLTVGLIDREGELHPCQAGTIESALLASARLEIGVLHGDLRQARETLESERALAAYEMATLRARLAAMESSRFWKLRNAWFRFKRAVGLTDEP